jgi:uncharacterized membrane protein YjjP (DUF1212 family)
MPFECSNVNEIVHIAQLCAQVILESGGETYRAEETVYRICEAFGFDEIEVIALPTGVFITISKNGANASTAIKRIRKRSFNLQAIETVNSIARQLTAGKISMSDSLLRLNVLYEKKPRRLLIPILAAGLSSGFFALLFKGDFFDFLAATLCGALVQLMSSSVKTKDMFNITVSILGGFLVGVGSVLWIKLTGTGDLDKIITGAIMPLLPGIPMTNAIRDTMRGDLVSGVSRGAEALLIAAALAFGVGLVLKIYFQFFI